MTARDDLIGSMNKATDYDDWDSIASAVLADGWSRPRVVTTVAELDALSEDSVVLSPLFTQGRMRWRTSHQKTFGEWQRPGCEVATEPGDILSNGPVTVLWSPPAETQGDQR